MVIGFCSRPPAARERSLTGKQPESHRMLAIASQPASNPDMLAIESMRNKVFDARELGEAVKRARRERGMTQINLAEQANVARSAVQKLEAGRGTVNFDTVMKLLRTLSLDLEVASRTGPDRPIYEDDTHGG